jgi:uncharacterized repeat protein (TIGR02543 family)
MMVLVILGLITACDAPADATTFEVTFDAMGGSAVESRTVTLGEAVAAPADPVREGFVFGGWYLDQDYDIPYDFINPITGNLTLYARWRTEDEPPLITLTFDANGGSAVTPIVAEAGSTITAPSAPTKEGYTFGGWYLDAAFTSAFVFDEMPATSTTLYAKWMEEAAAIVTITFHTNGGSIVNAIVAEAGDPIGPPSEPTKDDYVFGGWYLDASFQTPWTVPSTMPQTDLDIYAKWVEPADLVYTVTFVTNGGSYLEPVIQSKGQAIPAPVDPVRDGYVFAGWYLDSNLTTMYSFQSQPTNDVTLYAAWTEDHAGQIRISFETFDGTPIEDMWVEPGVYTLYPTNTYLEGHVFFAWYYNAALTSRAPLGNTLTSDITLYAKYEAVDQVVVFSFDSNGGSAIPDVWQAAGRMIDPPEDPIRTGYVFNGWYSDADLSQRYYMWYTYDDITLYAGWSKLTNSDDVIIDTLREVLLAWDFTCSATVCEYEIASGFTYIVHIDTGVFIYDKHTVEEEGGYRYFDSVITIDSNWDVDYTYEVDENYGVAVHTELTLEGNVLETNYTVTFFDSNVTSEASRKDAAVSSIEYFAAFVEDLLEAAGITMDAFQ